MTRKPYVWPVTLLLLALVLRAPLIVFLEAAASKLTALAEVSVPALADLLYWVDDPAGSPVSNKVTATRLYGMDRIEPGGRLTTETGVCTSTTDRTAQGTLYYTTCIHDQLQVYDGTRWNRYTFSEFNIALNTAEGASCGDGSGSAIDVGENYDVFVCISGGMPDLELSAQWTTNIARADALALQDGVVVKSSDHTRTWVGTMRASGSGVTADARGGTTTQVGGARYVWNAYNRRLRALAVFDSANSWSYTSNTWRNANGATSPLNGVEYVTGDASVNVYAHVTGLWLGAGNLNQSATNSIGIDGTTPSGWRSSGYVPGVAQVMMSLSATYIGMPGLGYHVLNWIEKGADNTSTFFGDDTGTASFQEQSGMSVMVEM